LKEKWLKLAGDVLEQHGKMMAGAKCNDWNYPDNWNGEEIEEFYKAVESWSGDPRFKESGYVPDWMAIKFLANELKKEKNGRENTDPRNIG